MKKITLLFLTITSINYAFSQTESCSCNELFDKDLKSQYGSFSSQKSKEVIYKYFSSDQTTRQVLKNDASMEGSLGLVIEAIPIDIGFSSSSTSSNNNFNSLYTESINNRYVSDELLQSVYISALPQKSFSAYEKCLELCKEIHNKKGITLRNISNQDDLVVLELRFRSTPSGGKISVKNAIYSSGNVVGGKKLEKNTVINDGQVFYEHIKLRPHENITVTITFNEGVEPASLSLVSRNKKTSSDAPIGTIVASLLNYNDFLKLNGLEYESDVNKMIWSPCDGRGIGTSEGTYGAYSGGKSPDLRGLFLRSVNDMGAHNLTVPTANSNNLNPVNKKAGEIQSDDFEAHSHSVSGYKARGYVGANDPNSIVNGSVSNTSTQTSQAGNATETRPKNMSVFFYVKIR